MAEPAGNMVETVEFRAIAKSSKSNLKGLDDALTKLNAIDTALKSIQSKLNGLTAPVFFRKTTSDIKEMIAQAEKLGRFGRAGGGTFKPASLRPQDLAKALGYDPAAVQNFLMQGLLGGKSKTQQEMRRQIRELYSVASQEFRSVAAASKGLSLFTRQYDPRADVAGSLKMLFGGGGQSAPRPSAPVSPVIPILSPASGGRPPGTATEGFSDKMAAIKRELAEQLRTGDLEKIAAARRTAAAQVKALVGVEGEKPGAGKKLDDAMAFAANQERQAEETLQKILVRGGRVRGDLVKLKDKAEATASKEAQAELVDTAKQAFRVRKELDRARQQAQREAAALEKQSQAEMVAEARQTFRLRRDRARAATAAAKEADKAAQGMANVQAVNFHWQNFLAAGGVESPTSGALKYSKGSFSRELVGERQMGGNRVEVFRAVMGQTNATMERYVKVVKDAHEAQSAWLGDFVKNTAKVAAWSASVTALYTAVELAKKSFVGLVEVNARIGQLDQVFRGVGGTANEVASDVLHMASAIGRSDEEAMDSAIRWARMGLTRSQINQAVRLSLIGANVAQLTAAETTEHLTSIMQNYNLRVGELSSVLGELNQVSNTYNVTNADLLQGIARTSAAAKQAGLPLHELMGIIGATVGATGQTGANIGNAVKSITLALSNPELQRKLRMQFGFETSRGGEGIKPMNQMLADLYVRYQKLGDAERQSMLFTVAGRTQASRLAAILDNYVRSQTLAITAQLNLNSAEVENMKIMDSIKRQVEGLTTEWQRFVFIQGNRGPVQAIEGISKALRNVLSLMNSPGANLAVTGMMGLFAAAGAKTLLTGMSLKQGVAQGFVGRSATAVATAGKELSSWMNMAVMGYAQRNMTSGGYGPGGQYQVMPSPFARGMLALNNFGADRWARGMQQFSSGSLIAGRALGMFNVTLGATSRALAVAGVALAEFWAPILIVVGAVYAFNKGMEAIGLSSEAAEKKLAGFNTEAEKARAAASAFAEASRLMQTATAALSPEKGIMRPEAARKMISQISEVAFIDEENLSRRADRQASFRDELLKLQEQNRQVEIRALLEERTAALMTARKKLLQEEFEARQKAARDNSAEIDRLERRQRSWMGAFFPESRQRQIDERRAAQSDLEGKKVQNLVEQENDLQDFWEMRLQYDQKHLAAIEREKLALQGIAELYDQIKVTNPMEKALVTIASTRAQEHAARRQVDVLNEKDKQDYLAQQAIQKRMEQLDERERSVRNEIMERKKAFPVDVDTIRPDSAMFEATAMERARLDHLRTQLDQIDSERKQAQTGEAPELGGVTGEMVSRMKQRAQLLQDISALNAKAAGTEANLPLYQQQARFGFGQQRAERGFAGESYGYGEAGKLAQQRKHLDEDIRSLEKQIADAERSGAEALEMKGRLVEDIYLRNKNNLDLLMRQADVEREIKQLKIDQNKEFMRSFFGSGPAEMLQKLAAFRMAFDKNGQRRPDLSQGAFFAMGPEMRSNYGMLNPNFNPQMIELRHEQQTIAKAIADAFGNAFDPKTIDSMMLKFSEQLAKAMSGLEKLFPTETFDAAKQSMEQLGSAAGEAAKALADLPKAVAGLIGGKMMPSLSVPLVPQSGGVGGGRGNTH